MRGAVTAFGLERKPELAKTLKSGSDPKDTRGAFEPMRMLVGFGHTLRSSVTS